MTQIAVAAGERQSVRGSALAAGLLFLAWGLAVVATSVGEPGHGLSLKLVTAFLLWRVWRGARWSRHVLVALSTVATGLAGGLVLAIELGATGINTHAIVMFAMYAAVGPLLCTPPVRRLSW